MIMYVMYLKLVVVRTRAGIFILGPSAATWRGDSFAGMPAVPPIRLRESIAVDSLCESTRRELQRALGESSLHSVAIRIVQ